MKKKAKASESDDDMRAEYDLSKMKLVGRRIYAERYRSGTNIVLLDRDVRETFPDDESVNDVPQVVAKVAKRQPSRAKKSQPGKTATRSRRGATVK